MADLSVEQGAKGALEKILSAGREQNGTFSNIKVEGWTPKNGGSTYDGADAPW